MTDLRKAAELALKALEELRFANAPFLDAAMEALRQALAQPEQKPVAWIKTRELELMRGFLGTAQRDWRTNLGLEKWDDEDVPLYTAPPKQAWSGLSVSHSIELIERYEDKPLELLEAAEAYLRGRNT